MKTLELLNRKTGIGTALVSYDLSMTESQPEGGTPPAMEGQAQPQGSTQPASPGGSQSGGDVTPFFIQLRRESGVDLDLPPTLDQPGLENSASSGGRLAGIAG